MSDFVDAVSDAIYQIDSNNYDSERVIIYCHPQTLRETESEVDYMQPFSQGSKVYGRPIEATQNIPEDTVMVVHLDAALHGPESIAFGKIG